MRFLDLWFDDASLRRYLFNDVLELAPGVAVVDLSVKEGVGTSLLLEQMTGGSLTVLTASPGESNDALVALADARGVALSFRVGRVEETSLPSASQDCVWYHDLLNDPEDVLFARLLEIHRILRPGGCAYIRAPEHLYFGRLPSDRLIKTSVDPLELSSLVEADTGQAVLGSSTALFHLASRAGFSRSLLHPLSMTRRGPFVGEDAALLREVLPLLGFEASEEHIDPFHLDSPFYVLDQPDVLLIESDYLLKLSIAP